MAGRDYPGMSRKGPPISGKNFELVDWFLYSINRLLDVSERQLP